MAKTQPLQASEQPSPDAVPEQAVPGSFADLALFAPGGPFESYPGAAMVVGRNGLVLGANADADPLADLLRGEPPVELLAAIDAALIGKAAQVNPLLVRSKPQANGLEELEAAGGVTPDVSINAQASTAMAENAPVVQAFDVAVLPWVEGAAALLLGRDVTLERSLRAALVESRQRYKDLVEISADFAWETDADGDFTFVSPRGALGYAASELAGISAKSLLSDAVGVSPFTVTSAVSEQECWVRDAEGESVCLLVTALPLTTANGVWGGARGLCRDVTDLRSQEVARAGAQNRERLLGYILRMVRDEIEPERMLAAAASSLLPALPATGAVIHRKSEDGSMVAAAEAGEAIPEALLSAQVDEILKGAVEAETGDDGVVVLSLATEYDGEINGIATVWRNEGMRAWRPEDLFVLREVVIQLGLANRQLLRQEELERLSATDPLTGLLNRRSFGEALESRFDWASKRGSSAALFYIDLDNFKLVNDRFGHQAGDDVLLTVTEILRGQTRSRDVAARLGGDEFALFFDDMSAEAVERKAEELIQASAQLRAQSGAPDNPLGFSLGIAAWDPASNEDLESLAQRADTAMYAAKRRGKGGFEVAPPAGEAEE
ncbi:sensor domain-containing diguanylate cyclase [Pelagibius sp. Alg239-R121]|uniref:sensor domain-containing diguanylate cyclase n=1 Tax=Pelagibius sp. Alg239-R121 TaxID=2993448 RepID=UPI0024A6FC56|nr:sensor domain-containing diguanylate cyclase [Pelagibius sp. Alg239-R121]